MSETNKDNPKIFISYSWTSSQKVEALATRLMDDGVEVVIDCWDLKEGQDKYSFMENSVSDPSINRVLIMCDPTYAKKADKRDGGVGDETQIISPKIYKETQQTKFIPVIIERNQHGTICVPAYLESRKYIDLSSENRYFGAGYEELLRALHKKPLKQKPPIGHIPAYLDDETHPTSSLESTIYKIDACTTSEAEVYIQSFGGEYSRAVRQYASTESSCTPADVIKTIEQLKPLKDIAVHFFAIVISKHQEHSEHIHDFFEVLYNFTVAQPQERNTVSDAMFEPFKFLIWELFISYVTCLLHYQRYTHLRAALEHTYFLREGPLQPALRPRTYATFQTYFQVIESQYKPASEYNRLITLSGNMAVNRANCTIINRDNFLFADLLLYQLYPTLSVQDEWETWIPLTYPYLDTYVNHWVRLASMKHCTKLLPLFGANSIEELRAIIGNLPNDSASFRYSGCHNSVPSILSRMKIEDIGKVN